MNGTSGLKTQNCFIRVWFNGYKMNNKMNKQPHNWVRAEVYDVLGQRVLQPNWPSPQSLNVSALENGVYILRAWDVDGGLHTQRFTVQR